MSHILPMNTAKRKSFSFQMCPDSAVDGQRNLGFRAYQHSVGANKTKQNKKENRWGIRKFSSDGSLKPLLGETVIL